MSTKSLILSLSTTGTFDGTTVFVLPNTTAQRATGQYIIDIEGAVGLLDPQSVADFVGTRGYWIHTVGLQCSNPATTRVLVGLTEPKPSIQPGGNSIAQPLMFPTTNAQVVAQEPVTAGQFVPPGYNIQLLADDGATPVPGRCIILLELETLPRAADSARAISAGGFPVGPVAVA